MNWILKFIPGAGALVNPWVLLILGAMLASAFFYGLSIGNSRLESYQEAVRAVGQAQEERTAARIKSDKSNKEKANAKNAKARAALTIALNSVRAQRASGGGMSAPTPTPASPDRICFDPAKLARAIRSLDEGVLGIVESGSKAVIDLDTARQWAQEMSK